MPLEDLGSAQRSAHQNFMTMLDISVLDEEGISYRLPDELHGDPSRW